MTVLSTLRGGLDDVWAVARPIINTVAPTLATAIGGPLAGIAARAISTALLGKDDASDAEIVAAVQGANPDQLLTLKQADYDFKAKLAELEVDLARIGSEDRNSARQREATVRDRTPAVLAYAIVAGYFSTLGYVIMYGMPPGQAGSEAALIMLGALSGALGTVFGYYYGTNSGSARKTEVMASTLRSTPPPG